MQVSDQEKFDGIKRRLADLYECHRHELVEGKFLRYASTFIDEVDWLIKEIEVLTGVRAPARGEKKVLVAT